MSVNDSNGRINVSEDRLRAVLAELELRLLQGLSDRFERKADVIQLTDARKDLALLERRVSALEKWRYALATLAAAALALAGIAAQYHH